MDASSLENMPVETVQNLALLSHELSSNPDTRNEFLRLIKKQNPRTSIPEIDVADQITKAVEGEKEKNRKTQDELLSLRAEMSVRDRRMALKEKGYKKEDIDSIEKLMVEKKVGDYDTAEELYAFKQQSAKPTPAMVERTAFSIPKLGADGKTQFSNQYFRNEAFKAVDELLAQRK